MAYAARYMFRPTYDVHEQLTKLFDFVGPTAIALWNLRWQVQGFLSEVPRAGSEDLARRFAFGSGMRGGELRRACTEVSWEAQLEQFAQFALINAIAAFEDFTIRLAEAVTSDDELQRKIAVSLQFPGGGSAITGAPRRDFTDPYFKQPSSVLKGVFTRDPRLQRRYAGAKLDSLLLCYRFFKAVRNAIAHNGGRVSDEVLSNYARFQTVATPAALGLKEVPIHSPVIEIGEPLRLHLRGVTGLTNVILHIATTYDIDFTETKFGEAELSRRLKHVFDAQMIAARPPRRNQQIISRIQRANLPDVTLTPEFEGFLKARNILPGYV